MDTIKKKMLAMKNEKDAAMDKAEQLEQNLKDLESSKSEVWMKQSCNSNCHLWGIIKMDSHGWQNHQF